MQLPLLTAFAYSVAFPLAVASVGARVGAVLVASPVYILAAAVLFQTDARRPLVLGAAVGLGGVAEALGQVDGRTADAAQAAELGLVRFRVATGRVKDAALPVGESLDSRAGRCRRYRSGRLSRPPSSSWRAGITTRGGASGSRRLVGTRERSRARCLVPRRSRPRVRWTSWRGWLPSTIRRWPRWPKRWPTPPGPWRRSGARHRAPGRPGRRASGSPVADSRRADDR
jgi:hypothetical protein